LHRIGSEDDFAVAIYSTDERIATQGTMPNDINRYQKIINGLKGKSGVIRRYPRSCKAAT